MRMKKESEKADLKLNIQKTKIMASGPNTSWQIEGEKVEIVTDLFSWPPKSLQTMTTAMKLKDTWSLEGDCDKPRLHIKKQRCHFAANDLHSQSYGFSSSHVWMSKLDHKEGWGPKNWCFQTVVLEETLESPLDCKENKPVIS